MLSQPFDLELINMDTFYRFDQESDLCQAPEDPTSDPSPRSIPSLPRNRKWANTTLESFQSTDKRPANSLDAPFVQHLNTASASATTGAGLSVQDMLNQPFDLDLVDLDTFYSSDQESDLCQAPEDPISDPSQRSIPSPPRKRNRNSTTLEKCVSAESMRTVSSCPGAMSIYRPKRQSSENSLHRASSGPVEGMRHFMCTYCNRKKSSASKGQDGRVRIRCECGGKHKDGEPRMHALWILCGQKKNQ